MFRFILLSRQALAGDPSVDLDPSTIGIPLFCSALLAIVSLFVLVALLSLPFWKEKSINLVQPEELRGQKL